jgi:uncharacterized protein YpmS
VNFKKLAFLILFFSSLFLRAQEVDSLQTEVHDADTTMQAEDADEESSISYQYSDDIKPRQFDSNFKSRYKSEAFQYEPKIKQFSQWQQFKEWFIRWLQKFFDVADKNAASNWFDYLFKFLIALLLIFVVYFIVKAILNKEGGWIFGRDSQAEKIDHTNVEEKLHLANFKELISSAKSKGDYRLCIRFYHLWLLRNLSDKKHIDWDVNKTNMDYLYELKNKELREQYNQHCYVYDYVWYGEFELNEEDFRKVESSFNQTIKRIGG